MTVTCSGCKKDLGEKCVACGSPAHYILERREVAPGQFEFETPVQCSNVDCAKVFRRGNGGVSHGLCKDCLAAALRTLPAAGAVTLTGGPDARACRGCPHNDCGFCTARPTTQGICSEYAKGAAA